MTDGVIGILDIVFDHNAYDLLKNCENHSSGYHVYCLELYAGLGDISDLLSLQRRRESLQAFLNRQCLDCLENNIFIVSEFLALIRERPEPLRVWCSQSSADICGLGWLMSKSESYPEEIKIINVGGYSAQHSVGEINPSEVPIYAKAEIPISNQQRKRIADQWKILEKQNSSLRVVLDGIPISVKDDFFDPLILRFATRVTNGLMIDILQQVPGIPGDFWLQNRIEYLLKNAH